MCCNPEHVKTYKIFCSNAQIFHITNLKNSLLAKTGIAWKHTCIHSPIIIIINNSYKVILKPELNSLCCTNITKTTLTYISANKTLIIVALITSITYQTIHTHTHNDMRTPVSAHPLVQQLTKYQWSQTMTPIWICLFTNPTRASFSCLDLSCSLPLPIPIHPSMFNCHTQTHLSSDFTGRPWQTRRFLAAIRIETVLVHFLEWPAENSREMVPWNWKNVVQMIWDFVLEFLAAFH